MGYSNKTNTAETSVLKPFFAGITADFIQNLDPKRERCWIAERDGKVLGCIMLVNDHLSEDDAAKIRLLLLEPNSRGFRLGRELVKQCIQFAREAGYSKIALWSQRILTAAQRMYAKEGFDFVKSEEYDTFGAKLMGGLSELVL